MYAFAPSASVTAAKPAIGSTSFATPLSSRPSSAKGTTMVLATKLASTKPGTQTFEGVFGGAAAILDKADAYMAKSIRRQYLAMSNPTGVYSISCTEGSVKFAAEVSRVRSLNTDFRYNILSSTSKRTFDLFQNRKAAIASSHGCHHEETQFSDYAKVASSYNVSKSEAYGQCFRYASPETVEEAAMVRYMDIQQNNAMNPSGVYNIYCNEGAARGQAEDIRVASLNAAYRQGQKSTSKLTDEKYRQKEAGYAAAHGCNYESGLVSKYPAIGAAFRPKSYGY